MAVLDKCQAFLQISQQFQLGHLVTESFHPKTTGLSSLVKTDVRAALALLQTVDRDALELMKLKTDLLYDLAVEIKNTLKSGGKVFLCGCGATGRLSLVLETLYRQKVPQSDQVISFMAGGDFALIKSVESFEDKTEYGERQLLELGFGEGDLLLASTEGGETPFVIGACMKAAEVSSRRPYFLYCNPDELLLSVTRSREVLESPRVRKLNLTVGPMAISGSTRMQASTVLMLGIGVGLLHEHPSKHAFASFYQDYLRRLTETSYGLLAPFTLLEAELYQQKKFLNYVTDPHLAITILTDTTERSPTFSLSGFENHLDEHQERALSYLFIPQAHNSRLAWNQLLWRPPRPVEWPELNGRINLDRVLGFDISSEGLRTRSAHIPTVEFQVGYLGGEVFFQCQAHRISFSWGEDQLFNHLMIKMLLNAHSTLIMGLLDRYQGNVMTWVRASNNKLIDRAARYCLQLLKLQGKFPTYQEVVLRIFEEVEELNENEPVVLRVVGKF